MSVYATILGQERAVGLLEKARRSGRVAHAYLFVGPDGVGKEKTAMAFAQALNCDAARDGAAPCGTCASCTKILRGGHPDVRVVASEEELVQRGKMEPEKARLPSVQIRTTQIDELSDLFTHRPYLGGWKVVVVVDAEKMNAHCQNRFLKTLEEPTNDTVIILVTAHPETLLPTVRSRCQTLSFGPLSRGHIRRFLLENLAVPEERAGVVAAMAQGSLGRAVALAEGDVLEARDLLVDALGRVMTGDLADLLEVAQVHGDKRHRLRETLDLLEIWMRDLLLARVGVGPDLLVNQDRVERIGVDASGFSEHDLVRLLHRIRSTRGELRGNANPRLAMESLLLAVRGT